MPLRCLTLLALVSLSFSAAAAESKRPPNIVVMVADDLGWRDLGSYGTTFYETPNLDRLAREGARFTDGAAACPVCSPTRASLLTGRYPQRCGVTDYIGAPQPEKWGRNTRMLPAPYADRLALGETTLAERLKPRGYATFYAGKWHLGPEGHWPENQGFDINKGGIDRGGPYGGKQYFSPYGNPRLEDGPPGEHLPDRLAKETAAFMAANKERPFLAWLSFYSVHTPLQSREDLRLKYEAKRKQHGLETRYGREEPRDVRLTQDHAVYAGMVEAMDQAVGKVLAAIDDLGLANETIVVFTSDNGGLSTSEGWPTSNLPLRAGKGWMYEGGLRVPLIIRWPGRAAAGAVVRAPVSSIDITPTLAAAAGAAAAKYDGIDIAPLLNPANGAPEPERQLFWHYPHYGNQGCAPAGAVRQGDWKYVECYEKAKGELYNVREDIGETKDLAADKPELAATLKADLAKWRAEVGAVMPAPNPKFDPGKPDGRDSRRPPGA